MKTVITALFAFLMFSVNVQAENAWCEKNCVTLCQKIYGAGAAPCIAKYQCAQYAGRQCASASYVQARYVVYCGNHAGECVHGSTR